MAAGETPVVGVAASSLPWSIAVGMPGAAVPDPAGPVTGPPAVMKQPERRRSLAEGGGGSALVTRARGHFGSFKVETTSAAAVSEDNQEGDEAAVMEVMQTRGEKGRCVGRLKWKTGRLESQETRRQNVGMI